MLEKTQNIFLATTALEDFWDISKPMVFLSDACTRYSRKHIWQNIPHEILINPLFEHQRYCDGYKYVQSFYDRVLPQIGGLLNEIHGKKYSVRYWRILLGFWLMSYIHMLYERYYSIKNALEKYPNLMTIILAKQDFVIPRDTYDLVLLAKDDFYNLQVYSKILGFLGKDFPSKRCEISLPVCLQVGIENIFKWACMKMSHQFLRLAPIVARSTFMSLRKALLPLVWATRGRVSVDLGPNEALPALPNNIAMRDRLKGVNVEDREFERLFLETFPYELPQVFMEGFSRQNLYASKKYPFKPKAIWTATGLCWDEAFKFWAAVCAEDGTMLAGMQHGGSYGMDLFHPCEEHEIAINDRFYSWGWEEELNTVVKPMPAIKYFGCDRFNANNNRQGVLFTTFVTWRYLHRYHTFRNVDMKAYIQWQHDFIGSLPLVLKNRTRVRLFIVDGGWDFRERWNDFDPQIILEDWHTSIMQSMNNCRLHVCDHLSTVCLDAIGMGKPTILFWDREVFRVRPEVEAYMDDLRRVGILYDTPQEAAIAVDRVYDDVEGWWNDPQRQEAVKKFCYLFVRMSPNAVKEWVEEISLLAKGAHRVNG